MKINSFIPMIALSLMALIFSGSSTGYDYNKAWKEVNMHIEKGLPKSALAKVEEIYKMARSESNTNQIIKATLYKTRLVLETDELGLEKVVTDLEAAIEDSQSPTKQILHSYAAEIFQSYYQNQYYRISQRTDLGSFVPTDIRTWAPNNYRDYISKQYLASLSGNITSVKTADLKEVLAVEKVDFALRPTLHDLLLDRALGYFSQTGIQGIQPSFRFVMDDAKYLAPAKEFIQVAISSDDETSMTFAAIKLYQEALRNNQSNEEAYINYDLQRLRFVRQHGKVPNANEVYEATLDHEINQSSSSSKAIAYKIEKANYYYQIGRLADAVQLYKELQKQDLSKADQALVSNQLNQLHQPNIYVQSEQVYPKDEHLIFNLNYKNLDRAHLRIVSLSEADISNVYNHSHDEGKKILRKAKVIKEWTQELEDDDSYKQRNIEVLQDGLPYGVYAVIVSNSKDFKPNKDAYFYSIFHVSDLAYITQARDGRELVVVTDRTTGKPISNAEVAVYFLQYNRAKRKQERRYLKTVMTDRQGKASVKTSKETRNIVYVIKIGSDELDLSQSSYINNRNQQRHESHLTEIFTDRAIYRPGQTVHYKILAIKKDKYGQPSIMANDDQSVVLMDANRQKVGDAQHTTNEFGSASGSFVLPTGLLTGRFTLSASHGRKNIQVEEYKRPKFEVTTEELKDKVQLGDSVQINGKATALSGSPVTEGKVVYTVTRHTYYGWWSWYRRSPSSSVQVTTDEIKTAAEGSFEFTFKALAEANMDISKNPTYRYEVSINVTDLAGETRSTTKNVSISALPYSYTISIDQLVMTDALEKVELAAQNTDGQGITSKGTLTIHELVQPDEWQKSRYWSNTDTSDISKPEWRSKMGRLPHVHNSALQSYAMGKEIHNEKVTLEKGKLTLDLSSYLKAGKSYEIKLVSDDTFEKEIHIEAKTRVAVLDMDKNKLPPLRLLYIDGLEQDWEVGKKVTIEVATPDDELEIYYYWLRDWEVLKEGVVCAKNKAKVTYTPVQADKGGISLHYHYVKHNRIVQANEHIKIPWSDKQLKVELITKRDKVLPGAEEAWTIKLQGPKADKVAAEMVAAMYDASLDQFKPHGYAFNPFPSHFGYIRTVTPGFTLGRSGSFNYSWNQVDYKDVRKLGIPMLKGVDYYGMSFVYMRSYGIESEGGRMLDEVVVTGAPAPRSKKASRSMSNTAAEMDVTTTGVSVRGSRDDAEEYYVDGVRVGGDQNEKAEASKSPEIAPRTNLKETVFFYPHLKTDKDGNVLISFTMNEALTRWKLLTFAHDKDLRYGMTSHEVKTQKDLMIVPNAPRFLREGDRLVFPATVSNLTDQELTANAELNLVNPVTGQSINNLFGNATVKKSVTVPAGQSARVEWEINVPKDYKSIVKYTVKAWTEDHSDGEENILPVVTNQMMVTETEVLSVKKFETKTFTVDALAKQSTTMVPHAYTLEYTSNPVWYAVQALPYIMEYPYDCTEQVFHRYYANQLASHIANANPRIQEIFEVWKAADSDALLSNLEKNKELKYALLEESPWVREAQSETEQKKRIALLFDINKMAREGQLSLQIIKDRQLADGSFPWFAGGRGDEYITQLVVMGLAHLERLGVVKEQGADYQNMMNRALEYLDERSKYRYDRITNKKLDNLSYLAIQYLYIRSFYPQQSFLGKSKVAYDYYFDQAKKYWLKKGLYSEAMIGLTMLRAEDATAMDIKASLTERSFYSDELGRYWNNGSSYMWYQLPIETHAKLIEFFTEADETGDFVEDTKIWLLKNKQTNHWKTTKATADAIYALLLQGEDGKMISWIETTNTPEISFSDKKVEIAEDDLEAGTGYFKRRYEASEITSGMNKVTIKNNNETIGWGATYFQYFEDLDKITSFADNPLTMSKKLYKEVQTDYGPSLVELNENGQLEIGDRVISRVELKVDRNMSYVQLKDMRPSGFEPENVISSYKWQDGIGYYESTRDLATNFFISHLNKGTYVFEYPMRVVHRGDFSTGIATLQCMYAPEFTSHSEGVRVVVE